MKHKVKVTIIDKKLYPDLQQQYCADPNSGACACYNVGDEFLFERDDDKDDFWHMGLNTLTKTDADPNNRWWAKNSTLFRGMGCNLPIYLHRATGRLDYAWMDEGRKHDDYLLQRWNKASDFQNITN